MARMEDGTTVDGVFWGKLDIVHSGDKHKMEFTGTRLPPDQEYDFMVDSRVINKLSAAAKPPAARCQLSILAPEVQFCDVILTFSPLWNLGITWPPAEHVEDTDTNRVKFFLRVHAGGALEHFDSETVSTALYYEAIPDFSQVNPHDYIRPENGFAMSFRDFIPHLLGVLDQLGMSLHARTNFMNSNMATFSAHKNIAYRLLGPTRIAAAIDITVTADPCVFTRLFLIYRGLTEEQMDDFSSAGEKEANAHNWREVVGWTEDSKDPTLFRVLEVSVLEVS